MEFTAEGRGDEKDPVLAYEDVPGIYVPTTSTCADCGRLAK